MLQLFSLFFFCIFQSILAQSSIQLEEKTPQKSTSIEEKKENQTKEPETKQGVRFFSLNPGGVLESTSVSFTGRGVSATSVQRGEGRMTWLFDIKSRDFQFSENFGFHFLLHSSNFYLDNQFVSDAALQASPEEGESNSSKSKKDINTRISGYYSMAIPVLYYGKKEPDSMRFGLGFGPSRIQMTGNVDFLGSEFSNLYQVYSTASYSREAYLDFVSKVQIGRGMIGANGDPLFNYLLVNLPSGNNLELMGYYLLSKNLLKVDSVALFHLLIRKDISPLEAATLSSLTRTAVNVNQNRANSFMFFFETPKFGAFKFRVAVGGPIFTENGFRYAFQTFQLSAFVPIEF